MQGSCTRPRVGMAEAAFASRLVRFATGGRLRPHVTARMHAPINGRAPTFAPTASRLASSLSHLCHHRMSSRLLSPPPFSLHHYHVRNMHAVQCSLRRRCRLIRSPRRNFAQRRGAGRGFRRPGSTCKSSEKQEAGTAMRIYLLLALVSDVDYRLSILKSY